MSRIHIGLQVADISSSIRFYNSLFGIAPSVEQPDYAKWMLEDPKVNFSISTRCAAGDGVHFGIQVDAAEELEAVSRRLAEAGQAVRETPGVTCCYARSDKAWSADPDGFPWETFLTHGAAPTYGEATLSEADRAALAGSGCGCGAPERDEARAVAGPGCC